MFTKIHSHILTNLLMVTLTLTNKHTHTHTYNTQIYTLTHTYICSDQMKDNSVFELKSHKITCPSLSVDGDST
jgi:hypothetical protein